MKRKTRVLVSIKPDVLDPSGLAVKKVLGRQGFSEVEEVRIGKMIDVTMAETMDEQCELLLIKKLKDILANPIVEDCQIEKLDAS